ncbi:MAG: NADH-quinone oxidoreductase subunit L [Deltaproteobacteria bacterium]|nr:NADH-quinone oxidoreductase subunit L [Deltaproteobacteria bacterium]
MAVTVVDSKYLAFIPLLPLIGAAINGLFGMRLQRAFGKGAIATISIALPWAAFVVAVLAALQLNNAPTGSVLVHKVTDWIVIGSYLKVDLAFSLDALSAVMVLAVSLIGSLIHLYAKGYMADDQAFWRFFTYLNLFLFAMLVLVLADNILLMFVGWEGVGLCSYLLIGFWYEDVNNAKAGMKAFIVNRIGDFGFIIGFFILFWGIGGVFGNSGYQIGSGYTVTFRELSSLIAANADKTLWGLDIFTWVGIFFFIGATGKSAQIPLYVWLPDAMAGPTPVSALIHAATMVTAGVYMIARMNFMYVHSPLAMTIVAVVGAVTALFAATIGVTQYDIKKVLAYSTVSQLGYMFIGVGVGAFWAGTYHLLTHAFFKACLFLGAGSVILAMHHEQDMRKMGGLGKVMPITRWTYWLACVAISGFPIAAGFYSKDEILWRAFNSNSLLVPGFVPWLLGFIAAGLTSFYMWRSYFMTFTGPVAKVEAHGHGHNGDATHSSHESHSNSTPREQPKVITSVLIVLALGAVLTSFIGLPILWTGKAPWLEHWLEPVFEHAAKLPERLEGHAAHSAELVLMLSSIAVATVGLVLAWWMYRGRQSQVPACILARFPGLNRLVYNKYYVDEFYQATYVRSFMFTSRLFSWWDKNIIDGVVNLTGKITRIFAVIDGLIDAYIVDGIVNLVGMTIRSFGNQVRKIQTGRLSQYLMGIAIGAVFLIVLTRFLIDVYG